MDVGVCTALCLAYVLPTRVRREGASSLPFSGVRYSKLSQVHTIMSTDIIQEEKKSQMQRLNELSKLKELREMIENNPKQTVFIVTATGIFFAPWVLTSPAFAAMGFGLEGPIPGMSYKALLVQVHS